MSLIGELVARGGVELDNLLTGILDRSKFAYLPLEYYDVETVDQITARLEKEGGRASALLAGIIESAPFQRSRILGPPVTTGRIEGSGLRAERK